MVFIHSFQRDLQDVLMRCKKVVADDLLIVVQSLRECQAEDQENVGT